jgi:hypothetical protein
MPPRRRPHHRRVMPFSRLLQLAGVIARITARHNNSEISRSHGYSRHYVRKARAILAEGGNPFEQQAQLEQSLIDSLLASMPSRLQAVVDANGGHIPY